MSNMFTGLKSRLTQYPSSHCPGIPPGACAATLAHNIFTHKLYSSGFESSSDFLLMGSSPACDYTLLVSSICFQGSPDTASPSPVISTELPDASNHGREDNQLPNAPNPVPEVYTETPDVSNQGTSSFEVDRQKVLDAAEALLILHNSPQASQETGNTPGLDGE
ncbi:hypothetical protein HispidOSU_011239 [Sigmodon hispidus]